MRGLSVLILLVGCGSTWSVRDLDGDGFSVADGDCWDGGLVDGSDSIGGADVYPGAEDGWYDGIDQNCDGDDDYDADGDGYVQPQHAGLKTTGLDSSGGLPGGDCWDSGSATTQFVPLHGANIGPEQVHPYADDAWYDGVDSDCLGDDDFDSDLDGYGSSDWETRDGSFGLDCDDSDSAVSPDAQEVCNDVDDDCDALVDDDEETLDKTYVRV